MPYYDFTEMPVWQKANEVVKDIYKLTEALPKREDYALCVIILMWAICYWMDKKKIYVKV